MLTPHLLRLAATIALAFVAPAWAQQQPPMSAGLVNQLQDVEVQEQLIALGVLDSTAGQASRDDLRKAVDWFRRAYQFKRGMEALNDAEKEKLKEAKDKLYATTGLKVVTYKDSNPRTKTDLRLLVPVKLVSETPQKFVGTATGGDWQEYRDNVSNVSVGPVIHLLSDFTPIALFRQNIMQVALNYRRLHLTSEEFAAVGDAEDKDGGYVSSNLVLTSKDKLMGVLMRYRKTPPKSFVEIPDFLARVVEAEPAQSDAPKPDPTARGWQLMMQGVANLVVSAFPRENGWSVVDTKPCPETLDKAGPSSIRILFGTDRKGNAGFEQKGGPVANPDSLFLNEPGNKLHIGCAYVVPAKNDVKNAGDLASSEITWYHLLHSTPEADLGDQLYLAHEFAERAQTRTAPKGRGARRLSTRGIDSPVSASSALLFIHGYNVSFKDALFTVAQIKSATNYSGRIYMYSWPSAASTLNYIADMDNAEEAEPFLQSFLKLLMRDADIDDIDILVHSMGSQPVLRALSALRSVFETEREGADRPTKIRIGQIMFAAPDVARPVFDQKIRRIAPYADRVTVYASMTDAALLASKVLRSGASRMGELNDDGKPLLVEVKNVHVIDATGPERWWRLDRIWKGYGHDYFLQSEGVRDDIKRILASIGEDDTKTPSERSPEWFDKVPFEADKEWFYWRLHDRRSQEK
jgi:esterase/lipase superfamily enzyme